MTAMVIAMLAGGVAAGLSYAAFLGYFGGPIYTYVDASRPASRADEGTVAVFFSGDMGFNTGMGPRIVRRLAGQGIPVVGVNSLTAFARRRTPEESAAFVRDAVARAAALPKARRIILVGQSFGANIVLAGVPNLPPTLRAKVSLVELVVPERTMLFRATPGGVFDWQQDGEALPEARRITELPVMCLHGESEAGSLCPEWRQANVVDVSLPGDHFLNEDAALVAATLMRGFDLVAPPH